MHWRLVVHGVVGGDLRRDHIHSMSRLFFTQSRAVRSPVRNIAISPLDIGLGGWPTMVRRKRSRPYSHSLGVGNGGTKTVPPPSRDHDGVPVSFNVEVAHNRSAALGLPGLPKRVTELPQDVYRSSTSASSLPYLLGLDSGTSGIASSDSPADSHLR